MNNRLQQLLAAENISQSVFADTIGVARASVSHILAGRNKPGFDFIESVSRHYPNVNLEWLITGKGKMYKGDTPDAIPVPAAIPQKPADIPAPKTPEAPQELIQAAPQVFPISSITSSKNIQQPKAQRSISKIMVLYNDGSYQEFK